MHVSKLTHIGPDGEARMVDVGSKPVTKRVAIAKSRLKMDLATVEAIRSGLNPKGEVLQIARFAGIQGAKQTSNLIPLCHPIGLDSIDLAANWIASNELEWTATATVVAKTGVEMEALIAAAIAALTVYDMCKAIDQTMEITHVGLWFKEGGARGRFERQTPEDLIG